MTAVPREAFWRGRPWMSGISVIKVTFSQVGLARKKYGDDREFFQIIQKLR